jgi:undecaprenyl diphosphate synthase
MSPNPIPLSAFATPRHVAIIMDGNGRWASARGLPRGEGHRRGVEALRKTVRAAGEIGISFLTIFSFSAENWSRPPSEIRDLMGCCAASSQRPRRAASERRQGARDRRAQRSRSGYPAIAGGGGRADSGQHRTDAGRCLQLRRPPGDRARSSRIAAMVKDGTLDPSAITADLIGQNLDAPDLPDPDLIIRTSGEQRLSNFLLWQIAYSELVFVPTYWPDFDRAALESAIAEYHRRERRFGGLIAQTGS